MFPLLPLVVFLSLCLICSHLLSLSLFSCTFLSHACFHTPSFPLSSVLSRVLWFPNLHVSCPCSVLRDTQCASCRGYLRVRGKKIKTEKAWAKHCTSWVLAAHCGDILTAGREAVGTNCDTTNTVYFSLAQFTLSRVWNMIQKACGTEMATWYHNTCCSLNWHYHQNYESSFFSS